MLFEDLKLVLAGKKERAVVAKEEVKEVTSGGWSKEDIALLTKGIAKFPPGTG